MKSFLLLDDHDIIREGLRSLLFKTFDEIRVDDAASGQDAIALLKTNPYDLLIADVHVPDTDIFEMLKYVKEHYPATRALVFSMTAENIYGRKFFQAGAMGFISKASPSSELEKAIRSALNGQKYFSPEYLDQLSSDFRPHHLNPFRDLSSRELEICIQLMGSQSLTQIAAMLGITVSTVATHKARILKKLRVTNMVQLNELGKQYDILR